MGYTTWFQGSISVEPPLNKDEISFLRDLSATRRVTRERGPLFVGDKDTGVMRPGNAKETPGESRDIIQDAPQISAEQPGLWLEWIPSDDGTYIEWNQAEKFYDSAEWMLYIIKNLLAPTAIAYLDIYGPASGDKRLASFTCDHVCNGEIEAEGEDSNDRWKLIVKDNQVFVAEAHLEYGPGIPVSPSVSRGE